ncbi:MAG: 3-hydroxyacyl-ACP dehydratase FabZ [Thermodesulfovibrionales bacterium]
MTLDINEIKGVLPHRYPFLLVDRVTGMEKEKSITGLKNVTVNEEFFQGHFPENPIMPGVLIVEALAQLSGLLAIKSADKSVKSVYFMSIEKAKFRKPVVPGDQLRLEAKVLQRRGNVWRFACAAHVEDKVVSEAEITAMMAEEGA